MTDLTLATRPLIPYLQGWLSDHAGAINSFSNSVGVNSTLVMAGPMQEASTIITMQPYKDMSFDFSQTEPPLDAAPTERLFDVLIDHVLVPMKSSAQIASDFADRQQALEDGAHPPDGMDGYKFKIEHVTRIMHHAGSFCAARRRSHGGDPSVWIGVRPFLMQRV